MAPRVGGRGGRGGGRGGRGHAADSIRVTVPPNATLPKNCEYPCVQSAVSLEPFARPVAALIYHTEKTGGSAVMKWLHKQVGCRLGRGPMEGQTICRASPLDDGLPRRLGAAWPFTHSTCFFALFPDIFPAFRNKWEPRRCGAPRPLDWRKLALGAEFHSFHRKRFWATLEPALPRLQRLYRDHNGTLLTSTTVREPVGHAVSVYLMWPPTLPRGHKRWGNASKELVPLPAWIPHAAALQSGALALTDLQTQQRTWHNPAGCSAVAEARVRLALFDSVGVLDCLREQLQLLRAALGWPEGDDARLDAALEVARKHKPSGVRPGGKLWTESREWALAKLGAPTRAALFEAVACDRALYFDAARRLGAGVLPAEAAPAAERRSLAEQLGEATRVRPVCKAARAPVYSARYSDLKNGRQMGGSP